MIYDCTQSARAQRRDGGRKGGKEAPARCTQRQQTADDMRGGLTPMMASRSRNGIPRSQSSGSRWIARAWLSPLRF